MTERQRRTLAAVCETLVGAREPALSRAATLIAALKDPRDRARLGTLLAALDRPLVNLLLSGRPRAFAAMTVPQREAVLRGWAFSRLALRRAGFQALKRLVHVAHYCWPATGGTHPTWRAAGYPGPLPPLPHPPAPLRVVTVDRDTTLDCDIVVVGSGAGGGVAAGLLAEARRSVVVLDKGPNPDPGTFTAVEGDMLGRLYLDGGLMMTQTGSLPILAGSCLGGGTVINYTTSFALPDAARTEWDARSGLDLFTSARFRESLERVQARVGVGTRWCTPGRRDELLEQGCQALGWHVGVIPRNVTDCREGAECGYCGYGCRFGAKNSTAQTYLRSAVTAGARLVADCEVEHVVIERGRATGVAARVGAHRLHVRANTVVVACGSIYTPALLARSGVAAPQLGRNLHLHPATALAAVFPERVEPWTGALQTRYSDQLADQDAGYGTKFETAPVHFALPASGFGWEGAAAHRGDLARLGHTSIVGVLLRDRDAGRVAVSRAGHPRVHYELSDFDVRHVRAGLIGAARVLAAAGATELFSLHTPPVRVRVGAPRWLDRLTTGMDRLGYTRCRMSYISFHQMGTAAMGRDPARSVTADTGRVHGVAGLYVADGSSFPTSSGVNPMITIMAIADHVARGIIS